MPKNHNGSQASTGEKQRVRGRDAHSERESAASNKLMALKSGKYSSNFYYGLFAVDCLNLSQTA